ncbi:MAG: hypothetical protein KUG73_10905 [Pseudomonadales bacterium]|nr:hypothetical protein [Pseudomonadales bacterium]
MTTRYFLAFPASAELIVAADKVLDLHATQATESWVPHFDALIDLFVPGFLNAFLVDTCDAVGLSPRSSKIIHSTTNTLSKTISLMVGKLLKKRSNEELIPMAEFIGEVYLRENQCSSGKNSVGCEIDKVLFDEIHRVTGEVREGHLEEVRSELAEVMLRVVDATIESMMVRTIGLLKTNFVVTKICDAAVATCRGAGHMVVNKVFKNLDEESMLRLGVFFEDMLVSDVRS